MKFTIQIENSKRLDEALKSNCQRIRFGPEFCEWKLPNMDMLKKTYTLTKKTEKEFCYVTPHTSNQVLEKIRKQLKFIDEKGGATVIVNDLGVLNIVEQFPNLKPHMGRQLVTNLARCPWKELINPQAGNEERRRISKTIYQTSLNCGTTIQFFKEHGIEGADVDWIPECFKHYGSIKDYGIDLSIYLQMIPVSVTRRCHMARFLGYENPEKCPKPCLEMALTLDQPVLGMELLLHGNTIFRLVQPTKSDIRKVYEIGIEELVIPINPILNFENHEEIDGFIEEFKASADRKFSDILSGLLSRSHPVQAKSSRLEIIE